MGFKITVNNEDAWESDIEGLDIVEIAVQTPGGEATRVPVSNTTMALNIEVVERNRTDSDFLDVLEADATREKASAREEADQARVEEGRAKQAEEDAAAAATSSWTVPTSTALDTAEDSEDNPQNPANKDDDGTASDSEETAVFS